MLGEPQLDDCPHTDERGQQKQKAPQALNDVLGGHDCAAR